MVREAARLTQSLLTENESKRSSSFLKKRTKKLLPVADQRSAIRQVATGPPKQSFLFLFSKKKYFVLFPTAASTLTD
jgi:hypothetical protein